MLTQAEIMEAIRPVVDPELMLSIVDLGRVYGVNLSEDGKKIVVQMTLTSPMCPVGPQIIASVKNAVSSLEGIEESEVELVWDRQRATGRGWGGTVLTLLAGGGLAWAAIQLWS